MSGLKNKKELSLLQKEINKDIKSVEIEFETSKESLHSKLLIIENVKKELIENNVLNVQEKLDILEEKEDLKFNQNHLENIVAKSISLQDKVKEEKYDGGTFLGFIYGLIFSSIVSSGIFIYIAGQNGIPIDEKLLTTPLIKNTQLSNMFGGVDPLFIILGFLMLSLFILVVSTVITQKSHLKRNNKKIELFKNKLGEYKLSVGDKINNINDIKIHLDKYLKALNIYKALLLEESGKLDRIIFFVEEELENTRKPLIAISNTQEMLFNLDYLISTDILTNEGLLSVDAIGSLTNSIDYLNIYIDSLYKDE